jgi:hypothetical protein
MFETHLWLEPCPTSETPRSCRDRLGALALRVSASLSGAYIADADLSVGGLLDDGERKETHAAYIKLDREHSFPLNNRSARCQAAVLMDSSDSRCAGWHSSPPMPRGCPMARDCFIPRSALDGPADRSESLAMSGRSPSYLRKRAHSAHWWARLDLTRPGDRIFGRAINRTYIEFSLLVPLTENKVVAERRRCRSYQEIELLWDRADANPRYPDGWLDGDYERLLARLQRHFESGDYGDDDDRFRYFSVEGIYGRISVDLGRCDVIAVPPVSDAVFFQRWREGEYTTFFFSSGDRLSWIAVCRICKSIVDDSQRQRLPVPLGLRPPPGVTFSFR